MSKSGYPTPDAQAGDVTYGCIPVVVPNNTEFQQVFAAAVYGLYAEMSNEWFWKEAGTLSPLLAAQYSSYALALTEAYAECGMSCEDVADCIETSEVVATALQGTLNALGYGGGNSATEAPVNTLTAAQTAENLLPTGYSCTDAQLMATARGIVVAIHQGTLEFLSNIELVTAPVEFLTQMADNFEVVSWFASIPEALAWVQGELLDVYEASYTQTVEDSLACALYCLMKADCELTLDMLSTMYTEKFGAITPPPDFEDPQGVVSWLLALELSISESSVAAFHWFAVNALRFSRPILKWLGMRDFADTIAATMGQSDTSYTICDDCPPTETPDTYSYMDFNFAVSENGWLPETAATVYRNGGWESVSGSPAAATIRRKVADTNFRVAGVRVTSLRRGSIGNGSFDYKRFSSYPNADFTGTLTTHWTANFISCNTNNCVSQKLDFTIAGVQFKAMRVQESVDGAFVANTNFCRITRVEVWFFNEDDTKPPGAVWVTDRV